MNGLSNRKQWLSTHLYYAEPWEDFLIYGIKPFIEDIKARKLADQFFFIRYWLKGPHIRLRIKGDHHVLKNELKPYLITYFKGFFHQKPSTRKKSAWSKNEKPYQQWLPNNSIQFINYEPETKRYGGKEAIALAEFQFESSSTAVLTVLEENLGSWDYDMAMGYALQLHLSFAFAIGMNLQETSKYFNAVFENWLPQAFCFYEDQINEMELQNKKKIR